jgi:hypothetical protein
MTYPTSIVIAGLEAVWDLQDGENTGYRAANLTKQIGVDALDPGMAYDGTFVTVSGSSRVITGWNFNNAGGVYVSGGSATFTDCNIQPGATAIYCLEVETGATVTVNHCTFDGTNGNENCGCYIVRVTGSLTMDNCRFVRWPTDAGVSFGTFVATDCYYLLNSDGPLAPDVHFDFHTLNGGNASFTGCFFDARGWTGGGIDAAVNNYVRITSTSAAVTACTIADCIAIGQPESGGLHPFHIVVDGNPINNVVVTGNVWEPGASNQYWYPANTASITTWSGNIVYNNGATYPFPNDSNNPAPEGESTSMMPQSCL